MSDAGMHFVEYPDLAAERLGGRAVVANDEFFAPKENLLKGEPPTFQKGVYTDRGQLMDGWETRRRREPGYDWCIIRLGIPGRIHGVVVDTAFFTGNYPESCSVEAAAVDPEADADWLTDPTVEWIEIVPQTPLQGDTRHEFPVDSPYRYTHVRLNIFPDGGVARFRVHGQAIPDWNEILAATSTPDLIALEHGGHVIACSDQYFSSANNLLLPGPSLNMGDGWETKRRRGPGHDWVVIAAGIAGVVDRFELATTHYKGNAPGTVWLEGRTGPEAEWLMLVPERPVHPHADHVFDAVAAHPPVREIRLSIAPDGGVARLRAFGAPDAEALRTAAVRFLDAMTPGLATETFLELCGSRRWAEAMVQSRPFGDVPGLFAAAESAFGALTEADWLEAFAAHPRIGERRDPTHPAARFSTAEQAAAADTLDAVAARLAEANAEYEEKFGFIYLVYASGRSAPELLEILERRLTRTRDEELATAAAEQRKITRLRLCRLIGIDPDPALVMGDDA